MSRADEFIAAVKAKDTENVARLLQEDPSLASLKTDDGSIILTAVFYGAKGALEALLSTQPQLNVSEAAAVGDANRLREILSADPSQIHVETVDGHNPLGLAAHFGHKDAVDVILSLGADVNALSNSKVPYIPCNTALHATIAGGPHNDVVDFLLARGADVNIVDSSGHTPLQIAAFDGDVYTASRLIERGADIHACVGGGKTAIEIAEERDHQEFADLLRQALAVKALDQGLVNDFVIAAHGDLHKVKEMAEANPLLVHAKAVWDEAPIGAAAHSGKRDIVAYLLSKGVAMNVFAAAVLGLSDRVKAYFDADPSLVHAKGAHGIDLFYHVAAAGNVDIAELMLTYGADVNAGAGVNAPLHGAAWFGQTAFAAWLIDHGADLQVKDYQGKTAITLATETGNTDVAELLTKHGATA